MSLEIIFNPLAQLQRAKKLNTLIKQLRNLYVLSERNFSISPIEVDQMLKFIKVWNNWYDYYLDNAFAWISDDTSSKLSMFENQYLHLKERYKLLIQLYKQQITRPYKRKHITASGDYRPDPIVWSSGNPARGV